MKTDSDKTVLWKREWAALAVFAAFIAAVIVISYIEEEEKASWLVEVDKGVVNVYIEGAVDTPGIHRVAKGSKLVDVLKEAGVKPEAQLAKWDLNREVLEGERYTVKARKMISIVLIYPNGKRKSVQVVKGVKVAELTELLSLGNYKVNWKEKKRKQLREGDEVQLQSISL